MEQNAKKTRKLILGVVSAKNSAKTGRLKVETTEKHSVYNKYIKRTKYIVFHDEKEEAQVGDKVQVVETRPLSRTKRHNLVKVVVKADIISVADEV
ncbi:MAG: 30S ribosomal protein S17 [Candidatus Cloacimonetes bacterium]|nr:30S ribosomal protein S17 [Candidatus Cloacimonadota bacterium]